MFVRGLSFFYHKDTNFFKKKIEKIWAFLIWEEDSPFTNSGFDLGYPFGAIQVANRKKLPLVLEPVRVYLETVTGTYRNLRLRDLRLQEVLSGYCTADHSKIRVSWVRRPVILHLHRKRPTRENGHAVASTAGTGIEGNQSITENPLKWHKICHKRSAKRQRYKSSERFR